MKPSIATAAVIVALALAIWFFFYATSERLTSAETTVVVGLCAAIVFSGKWCWTHLRQAKDKP